MSELVGAQCWDLVWRRGGVIQVFSPPGGYWVSAPPKTRGTLKNPNDSPVPRAAEVPPSSRAPAADPRPGRLRLLLEVCRGEASPWGEGSRTLSLLVIVCYRLSPAAPAALLGGWCPRIPGVKACCSALFS